jgi:hypothetical protein
MIGSHLMAKPARGASDAASSLVRDANRAGCVVQHGVADRAERHARDAAAAAGADNEQLRA